MSLLRTESMPIHSDGDVVMIRQKVRAWAVEQGFGLVDQTKIVTAASELGRNALVHGGGGSAQLELLNDGTRKGLRLTFEDHGPGIPDIELAMREGYSTGTGLGLGLSGAKRLCGEFTLYSKVGEGTRVTITRWK
jgi:serine/threonine-protein kinase RsbT